MPRVTRISISLITFFLFSVLYFATTVYAQPTNPSCKDIAKRMMRDDMQVNKIQQQMTNSLGNVYGELNNNDRKGQKSKNEPKRMDRHNRHINILLQNLGIRVVSMKRLLEDAKRQGNNCQEMVRKESDKVKAINDIHAEMERSLANTNTSESEFQDLIKNLKQQVTSAVQ